MAEPTEQKPDEREPEPTPTPTPAAGDGELERARRELADARSEAADRRKQNQALTRELEKLRAEGLSEQERAIADARADERAKVEESYRDRLLRAQVRAAAGGKLRDPSDAVLHLSESTRNELAELEGDELEKALEKAVDGLLESKPYLAAETGPAAGGNGAGETRGARTQGARARLAPRAAAGEQGSDTSAWLRKAARRR